MSQELPRRARVADIIALASGLWGIPALQLMGPQRAQHIVRVRFACYLIAKEHGHSFPMIGRVMGKDHSSVIHGTKQAENYCSRDPFYAARVQRLREAAATAKPFVAERIAA